MNIFIISISDKLGGAEQLLFKIGKYYKDNDCQINVCFFGKKTNSIWEEEGFNVIYCEGSLFIFLKKINQNKYSFVFSSHLMMNALLGLLRSLSILKTEYLICRESTSVFLRYSGLKLLKYKFAYWLGYRKIDLLITQSEAMKNILLENQSYLSRRCNIKTLANLFEFPSENIIEFKDNKPYVISAGRLIPEKGFDLLIKSFKKLVDDFPNLTLIILGEGEQRIQLENLILELNLQNKVILKGFVKDVYPYFKGAELCVVSSRVEGFPNVLLQMMSQNENVVSTLCAGGIEDLKGLVTCETNSVDELYKAMFYSLNNDMDNRKLFDNELKSRSVSSFVNKINNYLNAN